MRIFERTGWLVLIAAVLVNTPWAGISTARAQTVDLRSLTSETLPFFQDWSDISLIATDHDWSRVAGVAAYQGRDDSTSTAGRDPQAVLEMTDFNESVFANRTSTAFINGGVAEFHLDDPVVALQGSSTADAPQLIISINTFGHSGIEVSYTLRDIDETADDAVTPVALQYRIGSSGNFTNVPAAFVADATSGPNLAVLVTTVSVLLPAEVDHQPEVQLRILTWNADGLDEWVGVDNISIRSQDSSGAVPRVVSSTPKNNAAGVPAGTTLQLTFNKPVLVAGGYQLQCDGSLYPLAMQTFDSVTYRFPFIDPAAHLPHGASCTFTLPANQVLDHGAQAMASDFVLSFIVSFCGAPFTPIAVIQGASDTGSSPGLLTTQGFVTAITRQSSGFYIQSAREDEDANPLTSEGLYVFSSNTGLSVGDYVRVSGTVSETNAGGFYHMTQMASLAARETCSSGGKTSPTYVSVDLAQSVPAADFLEQYESMLVHFPGALTVQQNYFQGRYGQLTLGGGGRIFGPTSGGSPLDYLRMIVLDDGSTAQNPNPIPYYPFDGALRAGDILTDLRGVLNQGSITSTAVQAAAFPWVYYRVQPTESPAFSSANPRSAVPPAVGGSIKVASFNVLNYFTTLNDGAYTAPYSGANPPRGANTAAEFARQKEKIISGIAALDADVVGLIEIESLDRAGALQDLVDGLNARVGSNTYAAVADTVPDPSGSPSGYDFIQVALIYQPAAVTPVGAAKIDQNPIHDRVPVAQHFQAAAGGARFSVVVNHFKSKGSCPASGPNTDQGDGQGCWNAKRVQQAQALLGFIQAELIPFDPDVLAVGDFNAYAFEDPIAVLAAGGLIDQAAARIPAEQRYSYVFDGAAGYLDHILATPALARQVSGVAFWHMNADEPAVIDYNTEFKPVDLYQPHAYRSSDHDPVMIGLNLVDYRSFLPLVSRRP